MMQRLSMIDPGEKAAIIALTKASANTNTKGIGTYALPKPRLDPVIHTPSTVPELEEICSPVQLRSRPYRRLQGQQPHDPSGI